ncbi:MAG: extracellular solute-binding protein [Lachnospiraceae bacterium]|nr:extracellular solute-binding protein [Lachnospiraceae bacterium]
MSREACKRMKKQIKKALFGALTIVALIGLTGCGKGSEDTAPAREFYYVPTYQDIDLEVDYIQKSVAAGDNVYMFGSKWNHETGQGKDFMYCYQPVTGELQDFPIEMQTEKGVNMSIQQMAVNSKGNIVMMVNKYQIPDMTYTEDILTEEAVEETVAEETVAETSEAVVIADESVTETAVSEITEEAEATTESVEVVTESAADYAQPMEYREWVELWEVTTTDATVLSVTDIQDALETEGGFWAQYMALDGQDNVYFCDGNNKVFVLDSKGDKLFSKQVDTWINGLFAGNDGKVYVKTDGEGGMVVRPVDVQAGNFGEAVENEGLSGNSYNQRYYMGSDGTLLVNDESRVFSFDFVTGVKNDLFAWLDADVNSESVQEMGQLSDGRYWALLCEYSENNDYSFVVLKKTPAAEVTVKEEIEFATMWLDQRVRKNVIDFNKTNEKYRITVKEYGSTDYEAGKTQLNNDITGGNGPDIIDVSQIDYNVYAAKGVFEDLYPYMEKSGINKADYLENVFKAYETGGKLYVIVPQFYVSTAAAKASLVGDVTGWNLTEMLDVAEKSNVEAVMPYATRDTVFYYCVYNNLDDFINWETGECAFNSDEFIQVLEFAKGFPEEWDYNQQEEGTHAKIMNNKILLLQTSVSSVQEYQMMKGMFGGDVAFVGFPNQERKGNLIQPSNGSVAISAKSKHKDGAWEFVSGLISEEYQSGIAGENGMGWGFPIKQSALEKVFEKAMTPEYYKDENGKQVEQPKTSWGYDDFNIDIYAAKQEEVDAVKAIIASAEKAYSPSNEELTKIVNEEAAPFFKDQKSAKETADIIQNRVQIYVNENR